MHLKQILCFLFSFLISLQLFSQGSERMRSLVSNMQLRLLEDTNLAISWTKPQNPEIQRLALYKSQNPISNSDLLSLERLAILDASSELYIDKDLSKDISQSRAAMYYYLISIDTQAEIIPFIIPGTNALAYIQMKNTKEHPNGINNTAHTKQILQNTDQRSFFPLPKKNNEAEKNLDEVFFAESKTFENLKKQNNKKRLITKTQVFHDDLEAKAGEAYLLAEILQNSFINLQFKESEEAIRSFLMIHRSQDIRYKALFYLAQALYFQGDYIEALFYFIECQNYLFDVSRDWIDACLHILSE